ncbi:hypothetical protein KP509_06G047000 [Ceratopteris richardii]|uniref:Uncharacterized protein n=1 Tax=Ceratopteris richardii TaxID=49495 RepID=A0A8T2UG57_CERRI|nr:hypothetical protein KP509_06G047000 [Ceratopteris richardii]
MFTRRSFSLLGFYLLILFLLLHGSSQNHRLLRKLLAKDAGPRGGGDSPSPVDP